MKALAASLLAAMAGLALLAASRVVALRNIDIDLGDQPAGVLSDDELQRRHAADFAAWETEAAPLWRAAMRDIALGSED